MIDTKIVANSASDFKDLAKAAEQFITELYGKQSQFQIEEVQKEAAGRNWVVTVSYFRKHISPNELQKRLGLLGSRTLKRLTFRPNGEVVGITNPNLEESIAA
ncbi:MAG TPA: hypothetical protein PLR83_07475 [Pyrinomonadaceae bacterium]|nr:hypothetical protein [Pyrinomonadaceae bacterium]